MCTCLRKVDAGLAAHNTMCETNLLADPPRALVRTCKRDPKVRGKPALLEAAYCPFCGRRYPERKRSLANKGATT